MTKLRIQDRWSCASIRCHNPRATLNSSCISLHVLTLIPPPGIMLSSSLPPLLRLKNSYSSFQTPINHLQLFDTPTALDTSLHLKVGLSLSYVPLTVITLIYNCLFVSVLKYQTMNL